MNAGDWAGVSPIKTQIWELMICNRSMEISLMELELYSLKGGELFDMDQIEPTSEDEKNGESTLFLSSLSLSSPPSRTPTTVS